MACWSPALCRVLVCIGLAGIIGASAVAGSAPTGRSAVPPVLLRVAWLDSLPDGTPPPFENGDTLLLDTYWSQSELSVSARVDAIVATMTTPVPLSDLGGGRYRLSYALPDSNGRPDASEIPITLIAANAEMDTVTDTSVRVCLSNDPPELISAEIVPEQRVFRGGDFVRIESRWTSEDGLPIRVFADVSAIEPGIDSLIRGTDDGPVHVLQYRIPPLAEDRAPDGTDLPILLVARDEGCGETTRSGILIDLDQNAATPPALLEFARLDSLDDGRGRPLENGDTFRLWTRWTRDDLAISVDVFELAPDDTVAPHVERVGVGEYTISYRVPPDNPRADGSDIPICLIAQDQDGEIATDCSVRVCLSNHDPVHVTSYLRETRDAFRGGDTLHIVTLWESPSGLPLQVGADVSRLQPSLVDSLLPSREENDSLLIVYRIPTSEEDRGEDGVGIVIPIVAREIGGCGSGEYRALRMTLDTTPPDTAAPVLDPLPAETMDDSIRVSGQTTPEAHQVALTREGVFQRYVGVDGTGRFSGMLALLLDRPNQIRVWAEDSLRNRTQSSDPQVVIQVRTRRILFEEPFVSGASLTVQDPSGVIDLRLRIFDLEGTLLREWSYSGAAFLQELAWDARDQDGNRLASGYYLVRAEWRDGVGSARESTEGLILRN